MKTNYLLLVIVLLSSVVFAWCTTLTSTQTDEVVSEESNNDVSMLVEEDLDSSGDFQMDTWDTEETDMTSKYLDYNESDVKSALAEGKKVALFFHATWCPSCAGLDKDIKNAMSRLPENSVVFKVDYDSSMELKQKYAVVSQHTIVLIDKDMEMIEKSMWANFDKLVSMLE